ncbi:uncharacterized protein E0L32_008456 [Thyridium curvatum]|uniref:Uncharacterized protein n=1 Tax=Thyridium curvatum TaxID=1093900 RepID=A0A507B1Z2_9PEZI|nr:uncharacterized protein E0L32_008456 [Thyridium curvatum]TPX10570.1 hypothetical protein E0L32_008456 [Thyridium curvatum]
MAAFGRTDSPVVTIPPHSAHQAHLSGPYFPQPAFHNHASWTQNLAQNPPEIRRGRKRSRDEAAVNLDSPEKAPPPVEPVKEDEDEWEYGPGMILIKKKTGYVPDASSQSGTWVEEKAAEDAVRKTEEALLDQQRQAQDRPSLRSHKSSRLDVTASLPATELPVNRSSPGRDMADPSAHTTSDTAAQPVVDDFTLHLGIGWSRISDSEHIQAAARGWARYIENHFPVNDVKILLESKGLESYLVEAAEGYFLFAENLRQGRLVSKDAQHALQNLRCSPPVFEGAHTMEAAESPKPVTDADVGTAPISVVSAGVATTTPHHEVEMEMS